MRICRLYLFSERFWYANNEGIISILRESRSRSFTLYVCACLLVCVKSRVALVMKNHKYTLGKLRTCNPIRFHFCKLIEFREPKRSGI